MLIIRYTVSPITSSTNGWGNCIQVKAENQGVATRKLELILSNKLSVKINHFDTGTADHTFLDALSFDHTVQVVITPAHQNHTWRLFKTAFKSLFKP